MSSGKGVDGETAIQRRARLALGLGGTLLALQALVASGAEAKTLAISRVEAIREKMRSVETDVPKETAAPPRRLAQWWGNWNNWGNWPGLLPKKTHKWRWPQV